MKIHFRILPLIFLLLVSCKEGVKEDESKQVESKQATPIETLLQSDFWAYRTADTFLDGGSIVMGFINEDGEVLYVWFDFSTGASSYRRCLLKRTYNDKNAIEILPGTELEKKVISLIEKAESHEVLETLLPRRDRAVEILKTRKLDLQLIDYAKAISE